MTVKPQTWAIFCSIVDNYGDIGVCWRLAKGIASAHDQLQKLQFQTSVTLYIDDLVSAQKIIPALSAYSPNHPLVIDQVNIVHIQDIAHTDVADVVIEAFACGLPQAYLQVMETHQSCWIVLEYLSAEDWVKDFHEKPSAHPTLAIEKYYFFPGFTSDTGGLIREPSALKSQDTFNAQNFLSQLVHCEGLALNANAIYISLFCYHQANIHALFTSLANQPKEINLFLPYNDNLSALTDFFTEDSYQIGEVIQKGNLRIYVLPFISQLDYDHLLQACDLNFVRGEDSWVRALWASKPCIWQPYIQAEDAHIAKLNAFLQTHYPLHGNDDAIPALIHEAHLTWSNAQQATSANGDIWHTLLDQLEAIKQYQMIQTQQLAKQPDLVTQLMRFTQKKLKTTV
jgi:uncharacterized repeat protein (TIGR03837 family)